MKQFNYADGLFKTPKEFPMDIDLASCFYVSDDKVVAYAISIYTEANYMILPDALEELDGLRYCNGIEYQIYRLVE